MKQLVTGVTVTGAATATTFLGDLNGTINTATTAVTKANATNDTTVATTAFVQNLIGTIPAGLVFQGTWDAATNTPTLTSGSGTTGHFYIVSNSGSTNLDGVTDWVTGDWAVFIEQGATDAWEKIDNSSVLDGIGTGNRVAKWSGSGTSNTLTNSGIQDSSNAVAITINGNEEVGIGTVSPFSILHTKTSVENVGRFESTDATAYIQINDNADSFYIGTGTQYGSIGGNAGLNANNLNISLTTGNVGIGTTSPDAKLVVEDDSNVVYDASAYQKTFRIEKKNTNGNDQFANIKFSVTGYEGQTTGEASIGVVQTSNASSGNLVFGTRHNGTRSEKMRISSDGNVGIGTTNPAQNFVVADATNGNGIEFVPGATATFQTYNRGTSSYNNLNIDTARTQVRSIDYTSFHNGSGYPEKMRITSAGNVGIGTTSPSTKLDVAGNANISDTLAIGSLSTVPTASLGRALNIQVLANSSGTTVAQWLDIDRTITTDSTSAATWGMVLRNASTTTSTANDGKIYGAQIIGRHQGTGGIESAMGVRSTADINTTGTITTTGTLWGSYNEAQVTNGSVTFANSGIFGSASRGQVLGSGTVNITSQGVVGGALIGVLNNVNASVNRVVGGEFELDLQNGTTDKAHVVSLNTFNIVSPTNLSIDEFAYIYLGEDVAIPTTITDNAYFIKSLTSLPSELAGSIEATSFIKTGGTSSQFLKADGSIDSTSYAPATGGSYLPLAGGTMTGDLYLDDGNGATPSLYFKNGADNYWRYLMESGGDFSVKEGTSTRLTFQAGGNVGIGTTSPGDKLVVNGSLRVGNNGYDSTPGGTAFSHTIAANSNTTRVVNFDGNGSNPSVWWTNGNTRLAAIDGENEGLAFWTNNTAGSWNKNFYINPGNAIFTGNVGIGATSPSAKLDIVGGGSSTSPTLELNSSTSSAFNHAINAFNSNLTTGENQIIVFGKEGSAKNSGYIGYKWIGDGSNDNLVTIGHWASDNLVNIDALGNVGIGTTNPAKQLQVRGDAPWIRIEEDSASSKRLDLWVDPSSAIAYVGANQSAQQLSFQTASSDRIRILNNGNVGIGTTAPSQMLHVAGNMRLQSQFYDSTNSIGSNGQVLTKTSAGTIWADNRGLTPTTPGGIVATIVGETIEIAFNQSTTSNIDYYQVWSSDDGGDYGIIGQIAPADFSSTMTVVDTTFVTGGTMSYRVYAVKSGVYSPAGTVSKTYTVSPLSVTNMTVVNLNTAYYIQYEKPLSRFIDHVEIYMDSQPTLAALNRSNASIVYSGQNTSYMRSVGTSNNFHQFWVEIVTS